MSLGLRLNGKAIGIDPAFPHVVYADRDRVGSWEEIALTEHPGWVDVRFLATNRQLTITPDGHLESRAAGAFGEWEQLTLNAERTLVSRAGVSLAIDGYLAPPVPAPSPLHLEVRGWDFVDASGNRMVWRGCDMFLAYRQYLDGGEAALRPFITESQEIGFNLWRVFLQGDASQNQVLTLWPAREPHWQSSLRPFVQFLTSNGILPLLTLCVDNQVIHSDLQALWVALHGELNGLKYLASWGNELDKNGGDPSACPTPPAGVIWSRGSRTQDQFYAPNGATAAEFHPVRNLEGGRTQMDAVASVFYMQSHGCGMLWLDESFPFDNDTPPHYAYDLWRLYSTYWAVIVFHNRQSQRGLLMGPGTRACADAAIRGSKF